jgi:hypothetical protein
MGSPLPSREQGSGGLFLNPAAPKEGEISSPRDWSASAKGKKPLEVRKAPEREREKRVGHSSSGMP